MKRETVWWIIFIFCVVLHYGDTVQPEAQDLDECDSPMGMQSEAIPDSAISASSAFDHKSVGPQNSRIRTEKAGGAWCPKSPITPDVYEWLQVDFDGLKVVTKVETQGRFGNGQGMEFTEKYMLEYKRTPQSRWLRYRNNKGDELFEGNKNTFHGVVRTLNPPVIARSLRIIPFSHHPRTVCLRIEIHGCNWTDGIEWYSMSQGDQRGDQQALQDLTYDGDFTNHQLTGGLGQLTDRERGQSNFRLSPPGLGIKGYEWVGWKNDSRDEPPVDILFKFDHIRNFTSVLIHANNYFSKDVRVFRKAELLFSVGGKYFVTAPVEFHYQRDEYIDYARLIEIPIPHKVGKYVKLRLYYDGRWILISEVSFRSDVVEGNVSAETSPPPTLPPPIRVTGYPSTRHMSHSPVIPKASKPHQEPGSGGANKNVSRVESGGAPEHEVTGLEERDIGVIVGVLAAMLIILAVIVLVCLIRHRRQKYAPPVKMVPGDHITFNLNNLHNTVSEKLLNGNMYNCVATSELESDRDGSIYKPKTSQPYNDPTGLLSRKLPELPKTPDSTDTSTYAVPDFCSAKLLVNIPPPPDKPPPEECDPPPPPPHPHPRMLYPPSDLVTFPQMQGVSGNTIYAVPNTGTAPLPPQCHNLCELPRQQLKVMQKLGQGQFGEVNLCELQVDSVGVSLVAVKMLRQDADYQARVDFEKEVEILSQLCDSNIVRVLGVCTQDEPLCVVVEYMKYGDLHQFLQTHVPDSATHRHKSASTLSYGALIYVATQIASGMKYLESLNMVHRDLATRNCLVGELYNIKISDFGMSRSLYSNDYYRIEGRAMLPIRWMAWESVLLGKFSSKSDVWSFAVCLWEILTFAREQPFAGASDDQVIENCGHYYRNDHMEMYLPQPSNCPKEIYDLMMECWNRDQLNRPSFREIHMFLQRKNMGYDPEEDYSYQIQHGHSSA